ncbi:hypothetical protein DYU11_22530 [Fibrisoma montanum]|uniref:Uncharacterized protein n=1 Tax=Fibrisoma montanum TaxID=2305895 RepID=A0A418M1Z7_9BACT|nr:hypothetical protein [Fibrisoma montanum]RIV19708.1 hypothetical protein DYU11_22530 [Fibrisoma montanum]
MLQGFINQVQSAIKQVEDRLTAQQHLMRQDQIDQALDYLDDLYCEYYMLLGIDPPKLTKYD